VTVVSLAIFFSVLALLWFRVSAGEDPVLGTQASNAQVTTTVTSGDDETGDDDATSSSSSTTAPSTSSSSSIPTTGAS
jgi:hypothetical protein